MFLSVPDPVLDNLRELTRFHADMVMERIQMLLDESRASDRAVARPQRLNSSAKPPEVSNP